MEGIKLDDTNDLIFAEENENNDINEIGETSKDKTEQDTYDQYAYKNNYYKSKDNKWKRRTRFQEMQSADGLDRTIRKDSETLNLDCRRDIKEVLQRWAVRQGLILSIESGIREMNSTDYLNYLQYKTEGIVF